MKFGYARVSTKDQNLDLQIDALKKEGCKKIFHESVSGTKSERHELNRLLDQVREGDVIVIWKLDRLGRSLKHLAWFKNRLFWVTTRHAKLYRWYRPNSLENIC